MRRHDLTDKIDSIIISSPALPPASPSSSISIVIIILIFLLLLLLLIIIIIIIIIKGLRCNGSTSNLTTLHTTSDPNHSSERHRNYFLGNTFWGVTITYKVMHMGRTGRMVGKFGNGRSVRRDNYERAHTHWGETGEKETKLDCRQNYPPTAAHSVSADSRQELISSSSSLLRLSSSSLLRSSYHHCPHILERAL